MNSETAIGYLEAAVRLVGVNRFYAVRVLQRWERGEISTQTAVELLRTAAVTGVAPIRPNA
jgi:hypothetical protein